MSSITLVGTVHMDINGPKRLEKVLNHYQPEIICLEATPENAQSAWGEYLFIESISKKPFFAGFLKKMNVKEKEVLSHYYEIWTPLKYQIKNPNIAIYGIDLKLVDGFFQSLTNSYNIWAAIQTAEGLNSSDKFKELERSLHIRREGSEKEIEEFDDHSYDDSNLSSLKEIFGSEKYSLLITVRDMFFANNIRQIYTDDPKKEILAILGSAHVFGKPDNNVYDLLSDLNPRRLKLKEADNL